MFTAKERASFAPPERLTPSQWAEQYRYLTPDVAAEPGPYRLDRTPYIRGILDAVVDPDIQEIVVRKAAQVGYSTAVQNLIGWAMDSDPAPMLIVLPDQAATEKLITEQIRPLIESSPQLQSHFAGVKGEITRDTIKADTMPIYMAWSGSPQTMSGRAIRYILLEEPDKFPVTTGKEGDPVAYVRKRLTTFGHRGRMILGCTPTTPDGHVSRAWDGCGDHRYYQVPCPLCGAFQRLVWASVRWDHADVTAIGDRLAQAQYVRANRRAVYRCDHCGRDFPNEAKGSILSRGVWASDGQTVSPAGEVQGDRLDAQRVGFHLPALYSPWASWSDLAADFILAQGRRELLRDFTNGHLGEPFQEITSHITVEDSRRELTAAPAAWLVPPWAGVLFTTVDVQKDRFYFVVRAWGHDRSQLVHHGEVASFDDVTAMGLQTPYKIDNDHDGDFLTPQLLLIDAGYRTNEVYNYATTDTKIRAVMGSPIINAKHLVSWSTPSKEIGVQLGVLHTQYFKDELHTLRHSGRWLLNDKASPEYLRHLSAEAKQPNKDGTLVWKPITSGAPNHYLDCECYQVAASHIYQVGTIPGEATLEAHRAAMRQQREAIKATVQVQPTGRPVPPPPPSVAQPRPQQTTWMGRRPRSWI